MRNIFYYATLFSIICQSKQQLDCKRLLQYPCCYNHYLDDTSNSCTECTNGSFGWNCKSSCPSRYFGRLCKSHCECNDSKCHHVTGCTTTDDNYSSTISNTHVTTEADLLQSSTIANTTTEVSTYQDIKPNGADPHIHYQDIKPNGADPHIHYQDDHASPISILGFSLLGSFSSLCIIGCVLFIHSRKKKWKIRASPNFSSIRQVLLSCVNQARQQEAIQGYGDIELSNDNAAPVHVCGQEEDDSPYSEIRCSQFIGEANAEGVCINRVSCIIHKCDFDKHYKTSEKQNIYQMSMNKNEYDHVNLKVKSSDMLPDRNLRLPHSNDEEYVSLLNKPSLGKGVRPNDCLKYQNSTRPKNTTTDCNEMDKSERNLHRLLAGYSLQQLELKTGVEVDISEKNKHHSVAADRQVSQQSDNSPYSMAGGLSKNDLSETDKTRSNLLKLNISEKINLSKHDISEVVEDFVNPMNKDVPGKRENTCRRENNIQTNARSYSIAKIPEF